MTDQTIFPGDLAHMSVSQLASLSPMQKAELASNLIQAQEWLEAATIKFDAALEAAYGGQARAALHASGREFGTTHVRDGAVRITFELPQCVRWDQQRLSEIAVHITAAGERVVDYLDVEYSVAESRFSSWPPSLRAQFSPARSVTAGLPLFRLSLVSED